MISARQQKKYLKIDESRVYTVKDKIKNNGK